MPGITAPTTAVMIRHRASPPPPNVAFAGRLDCPAKANDPAEAGQGGHPRPRAFAPSLRPLAMEEGPQNTAQEQAINAIEGALVRLARDKGVG